MIYERISFCCQPKKAEGASPARQSEICRGEWWPIPERAKCSRAGKRKSYRAGRIDRKTPRAAP